MPRSDHLKQTSGGVKRNGCLQGEIMFEAKNEMSVAAVGVVIRTFMACDGRIAGCLCSLRSCAGPSANA